MKIEAIIRAIQQGQVQITDHADEEAENDDLGFEEIFFAVCGGEIIETYSTETPYPRYLIFGEDPSRQAVHSVWTYDQKTGSQFQVD